MDLISFGIIDATYRENGRQCQLTLAKSAVNSVYYIAQMFTKKSPYIEAINQRFSLYTFFCLKIIIIELFYDATDSKFSLNLAFLIIILKNTWQVSLVFYTKKKNVHQLRCFDILLIHFI